MSPSSSWSFYPPNFDCSISSSTHNSTVIQPCHAVHSVFVCIQSFGPSSRILQTPYKHVRIKTSADRVLALAIPSQARDACSMSAPAVRHHRPLRSVVDNDFTVGRTGGKARTVRRET